jgi:RNA polymerase sigma factor (sigma-70 family)
MPAEGFSALLDGARRGDQQAWAQVYRSLAPAVLGYLRANGAPDPEDAHGEVFLQVARDLGTFEGDERRFRAWVFTIAHHRLIDARRRAARRPLELTAEPPEPRAEYVEDAADQALARISADEVRQTLKALSPDQRAVLLLRVLGELTVPEVAKALGKRPGAIKALQRRGLAAIQKRLQKGGVPL